MREYFKSLSFVLLLPFILNINWAVADPSSAELMLEGKQVIKKFATELKSTLQVSVKEGGFVKGIEACSLQAENIASKHSQGNWTVSRTSLKTRNSKNVPDPWEKKVLTDFDRQLADGQAVSTLVASTKHGDAFRLMKAIPTQGLCLACHGASLSAAVKKVLLEKYPHDKATGYEEGEIRGAFSLVYREK